MKSDQKIVKFINDNYEFSQIIFKKDDKGKEYYYVDNGGGSDDEFIELSVQTLLKIVKKAYIHGYADGNYNL